MPNRIYSILAALALTAVPAMGLADGAASSAATAPASKLQPSDNIVFGQAAPLQDRSAADASGVDGIEQRAAQMFEQKLRGRHGPRRQAAGSRSREPVAE